MLFATYNLWPTCSCGLPGSMDPNLLNLLPPIAPMSSILHHNFSTKPSNYHQVHPRQILSRPLGAIGLKGRICGKLEVSAHNFPRSIAHTFTISLTLSRARAFNPPTHTLTHSCIHSLSPTYTLSLSLCSFLSFDCSFPRTISNSLPPTRPRTHSLSRALACAPTLNIRYFLPRTLRHTLNLPLPLSFYLLLCLFLVFLSFCLLLKISYRLQ